MKKLFVLIFVMLNHVGLTSGQTWNDQSYDSKIDPELQEEMNQKNSTPENMYPIIVMMSEQYDHAEMNRKTQFMDKQTKREFVINEMKRFTNELQADVTRVMNENVRSNSVKDFDQFWVFNGFSCKATKETIETLAARKDIAVICSDKKRQMLPEDWNPQPVENNRGTTAVNVWNVMKVNADDVWKMGYTGKGVIVAVIDTGVDYNHTDIKKNMWNGDTIYPHHGYDFANDDNDPIDDNGHGTACAGVVAGDGTNIYITGIAPKAKIMAIKVGDSSASFEDNNIIKGIQFAMENKADILSISIGRPKIGGWWIYRNSFETVLAAGIPAAVAAGNYGNKLDLYPIPNNISSPGNCPPPYLHPDQKKTLSGGTSAVICVGATDKYDTKANFSSVGPSTWAQGDSIGNYRDYPYSPDSPTNIGLIRPDIVAPGVDITSLNLGNGYRHCLDGTSIATPCVAGIIALVLESNPYLTPSEIDSILEHTAIRCEGATKKNNRTGSGRIDALAAVSAAINTAIIGNETNSTSYTPYNNYFRNSWNECIYPKESFKSPCTIKSISYDCSFQHSYTCSSLKIYMGERFSSIHSSDTDWTPIENLQLVYSASDVAIGDQTGWQNFTFDTPFEYTNTGNLVVVVSKTAPPYYSKLRCNTTYSIHSCLYRQDNNDTSYADYPNGNKGTRFSYRANIRLTITSSQNTDIVIGDGTFSTSYTPFNNNSRNSWNQCIYPKESFDSPCKISSISYDCSSAYSYKCSSLNIYMGEKSTATHSSNSDWVPEKDLQLVYSASCDTIGNKTGWQKFTLDTPFEYTKSGNLVVVVSKKAPKYISTLRWNNTISPNACLFRQSDDDLFFANHPNTSQGSRVKYRANIKLTTFPLHFDYETIGDGNYKTYISPFNNFYRNSWHECIYPKESIDSPCTINSISYDCSVEGSLTCSSLKIYMAERSSASHSSKTDWTPEEDLQLVYSASNVKIGDKTGWQKFELDTPFEYTNSGNLVVVVSKKAPSYNTVLRWSSTNSTNSCLYRQGYYNSSYAEYPNGEEGALYNYRANIRLTTTPSVIIGNGNYLADDTPFVNYYNHSWNENIYPKESFNSPCTINSVSYDCGYAESYMCSSLKIYMGERTSEKYSSETDWTPIENLQLVYHATNVTIGDKKGWQRFVLDTPFEYSKSKNLVIVVAKTAPSWNLNSGWNYTKSSNSCLYICDDFDVSYADYPDDKSGIFHDGRANILLKVVPNSTSSNGKSEEIDVIFDENNSLSEVDMESDEMTPIGKSGIRIYPNPAQNVINIEMEDNNFEYVIYNELGQVVRQGNSCGKSQINVEDCQKGLYLIKIATEEKTSTHKIVIE